MKRLRVLLLALILIFSLLSAVACDTGRGNGNNNNSQGNTTDGQTYSDDNLKVGSVFGLTYTVPIKADSIITQISQDVAQQIKTDFAGTASAKQRSNSSDGIFLSDSYGKFGNAYAVFIYDSQTNFKNEVCYEIVESIIFGYEKTCAFRVYANGSFYRLQEAYDADVISLEDLMAIWRNYYGLKIDGAPVIDTAIKYSLYEIPNNIRDNIRNDYCDFLNGKYNQGENTFTAESVVIDACYGKYNDTYVMFIKSTDLGFADAGVCDNLCGMLFSYSNSCTLTVYCDGRFYSLTEAYANGVLTYGDAVDLWLRFGALYATEK